MRIGQTCRRIGVFVAAAWALAAPAGAETIQIPFSLTVTRTFGDMNAAFGLPMSEGTIFAGRLTYDPSAPDEAPLDRSFGFYHPTGAIAIEFGTGISIPLEYLVTQDDEFNPLPFPIDSIEAFGTTQAFRGFDSAQALLLFRGAGQTDALPQSASAFFSGYQGLAGMHFTAWQTGVSPPFDSGTHEFFATARLLAEPEPVPEPGALLLVASGAGMLVRRYRRR